jgi:hypothetical protein
MKLTIMLSLILITGCVKTVSNTEAIRIAYDQGRADGMKELLDFIDVRSKELEEQWNTSKP